MTTEELIGYVKGYVRKTLEGEGAIRGVPCEIDSIEEQPESIIVTFRWQDKDGAIHHQDMNVPKLVEMYSKEELFIGTWMDEYRYRKVIEISDPNTIQKGVTFKVCDLPEGYKMLTKGYGIVKTYEGSYSNNDILVYATSTAIMARQNFTGYPQKMYIIIEYVKEA